MADLGAVGASYGLSPLQSRWLALSCTHAFAVGAPVVRNSVESKRIDYTISGTVYDSSGAPCVRLLRLIRRVDGTIVDSTYSAADGTYTMHTGYADEHDVVALDDVAGTVLNDLIARATPA